MTEYYNQLFPKKLQCPLDKLHSVEFVGDVHGGGEVRQLCHMLYLNLEDRSSGSGFIKDPGFSGSDPDPDYMVAEKLVVPHALSQQGSGSGPGILKRGIQIPPDTLFLA